MNRPDHLAAIDRHLRKDNWLLNEALIAELTDHYANAITERTRQGIPFETALWNIHKEFGGRKGLLKMEEEYGKTQAKHTGRLNWQCFKMYFQRPRLYWTIGVFGFINFLLFFWNQAGQPFWFDSDSGISLFISLMICGYILVFIRLSKPDILAKHFPIGLRPGIFLGQGMLALFSLMLFVQILQPLKTLAYEYGPLVAFVITIAIVFEAATFEIWAQTSRFRRRQKTT